MPPTKIEPCDRSRDLVVGRPALLVWWLPALAVVVTSFFPAARAATWIPAFAVMGAGCIVNARGCGRVHCHITGPLFLLAALATALSVPWALVLALAGIGTIAAYGVERARGKYVVKKALAPGVDSRSTVSR